LEGGGGPSVLHLEVTGTDRGEALRRTIMRSMTRSRPIVVARTVLQVTVGVLRFASSLWRSRAQLAAENLFLRKQLALYVERQVKPRRADDATRIALLALSRLVDWRQLLTVVKPETLIRWHRKGFRLFWRWKSMPRGRPPLPAHVRRLIADMAGANRTWGEERIASELLVKLGIRVSPRTVRRYMASSPGSKSGPGSQTWRTFVRNHARAVLACDFFVTVTATFRLIYVFVILDVGTRRILGWSVTDHPTAAWTSQQFRMVTADDRSHRFVVHDHDSIYSEGVDRTLAAIGLTVLRTPVRAPQANAFCERVIGTIRRECLDFVIPLNEGHVRHVLREWVTHYNRGRPHASLGPGIPDPPNDSPAPVACRHHIRQDHRVVAKPIFGGLHHEYALKPMAA
jgi:putative transposase